MSAYCATHGADVVLVDIENAALEAAMTLARRAGVDGRLRCVRSDSFPVELRGGGFDVVIAKDIIEHIEDDDAFLAEVSKCQNRGGMLLLSTQNSLSLNALLGTIWHCWIRRQGRYLGWDPTHLRFYTTMGITRMLAKHAYTVSGISSIYILPYGICNVHKAWLRPIVSISDRFDRLLGGVFPFNRCGWNFVLNATRT
jgi:2-polyprenyl-6-hydroxyphenyl methylase/3-demethylubiquinone-9 3-methyltransferase